MEKQPKIDQAIAKGRAFRCPTCSKAMILNRNYEFATLRYECPTCGDKIDVGPPIIEAA